MDLSQLIHFPHFLFEKPAENNGDEGDPDDGSGDEDVDDAGKPVFSPEQQKFLNKLIGETRKAEREKATKEAADKTAKEKEDADKKKLEEQGEFKKLAEEAEKKTALEKARADAATAETNRLKLQRQFEVEVAEAGLSFVSPKAAEDAFNHLDTEAIGNDYSGMEEEVKRLTDEYDYLFGESVKVPDIDAVNKSNVNNKKVSKDDLRKQKKSTGRYSAI